MIKIFGPQDTNFSSNGDEVISEYKILETKKKSLNGWYIDVECPIKHLDYIKQDNLCIVKTKSKINLQAFRIENIKQDGNKITFTAHHVMFDSHNYFLVDVRPTNSSAINALTYINQRTDTKSPFSYKSNVGGSYTAYFIRKSLFEAWSIIEERWGGVFDADNFDITFNIDKPNDKGATLNYGSDLEGIQVIEDWSAVVTKLYPTGFDGIMLPETFLMSPVQYSKPYSKTVYFDTEFEEEDKTPENLIPELRTNAKKYLDANSIPKVSYTVKSDVNQDMEIGDLIVVKHPYLNINTQVQEYTYDIVADRVLTLTFGNYSRDVKKKFSEIRDGINNQAVKLSNVEALIGHQTDLINNLNKLGFVYIDDNEILVVDKLPKETAKNVWRWGLGGFGFSDTGYEGPFKYAFTQDGRFNASFIAAGAITTNQLASDVGSSLDISSNESINLLSSKIYENNLIPNLNGEVEFDGWTFISDALYPDDDLYPSKGLYPFGKDTPIFEVVDTHSLSGKSLSFHWSGKAISNYGYVVPDSIYSYKARRMSGNKPYKVTVIEYDKDKAVKKRTLFNLNGSQYEAFSIQPQTTTMWIKLEFETTDRTEFVISEQMFTRGNPATYKESTEDVKALSQSMFNVANDKIESVVEDVLIVNEETKKNRTSIQQLSTKIVLAVDASGRLGKIELGDDGSFTFVLLKADSISLEGYTSINGNFEVLPNGDVKMVNADVSGKITANEGKIGGFSIENEELTGDDISLSKKRIKVGNVELKSWPGNNNALGVYTNQLTVVPTSETVNFFGISLGKNRNSTESDWFVTRSTETQEVTLRVDTVRAKSGLNDYVKFNRIRTSNDVSAEILNVAAIFPDSSRPSGKVIGEVQRRFANIYLQNQPNVSSDARLKYNIANIDDLLLDEFEKVEEKMFVTKHDDMFSFGYVAQDVERALYKFCVKVWGRDEANEWLKKFKVLNKSESYMSLLYNEVQIIKQAVKHRKIDRLNEQLKTEREERESMQRQIDSLIELLKDKDVI